MRLTRGRRREKETKGPRVAGSEDGELWTMD